MNTVIQILNDSWHEIEKDPKEFVALISAKMNSAFPDFVADHIKVMQPHHSSEYKAYISGGNTMASHTDIPELMEKGLYEYVDKIIEELEYSLKMAKASKSEYLIENEPLLYKAEKAVKHGIR